MFSSFVGTKCYIRENVIYIFGYYGYDISDYNGYDMSFEYSDNDPYEGSLSAYEQNNEDHKYDFESYDGYYGPKDYDKYGDEDYCIKDESEDE